MKKSIHIILIFLLLGLTRLSASDSLTVWTNTLKNAPDLKKFSILTKIIEYYTDKNSYDSAIYYTKLYINYAKKLKLDTAIINGYITLIGYVSDSAQAKKYIKNAVLFVKTHFHNDSLLGEIYANLGYWLKSYGYYIEAIKYFSNALKYFHSPSKYIEMLNQIGICYKKVGLYDKAVKYYQKALSMAEKNKTQANILAQIYNNIALIHKLQGNYKTALNYFNKIIQITDTIHNQQLKLEIQAKTHLNIAMVLNKMHQPEKALKNIIIAKQLFKKTHSPYIIYAYRNAGQSYIDIGQYDKAIKYLDTCIMYSQQNIPVLANAYYLKAKAYLEKGTKNHNPNDIEKAIQLGLIALKYAKSINYLPIENFSVRILYKAYAQIGDYKNAFYYALEYIKTNKILFNKEKMKTVQELEAKYQAEKKQQEIEKQRLIIEKQQSEMKRQKIERDGLILIAILLAALAYISFRSYVQKKRDNRIIQQKNAELEQAYEEIRVQRDQLQEQKDKIEKMHKQLQDSIRYAQRIQSAAMPTKEILDKLFDDYFVFFRPLNIVSGDFYWAKQINDNYIAFTVADCTGHGVPGAFVSMLAISLLNEIIRRKEITTAAQVLEEMRKEIKISLKQSTSFEDSKDGVDMAFCIYDKKQKILQYAGANNPLYLIRQGQLIEYKPVKNPVAIYIREMPFKTHYIKLEKGDIVYLSSDGFYDQPGGPEGKKFFRKNFKNMLLRIWNLPMEEQLQQIEKTFLEWKNGYRQIDDVCVMGVKFEFNT